MKKMMLITHQFKLPAFVCCSFFVVRFVSSASVDPHMVWALFCCVCLFFSLSLSLLLHRISFNIFIFVFVLSLFFHLLNWSSVDDLNCDWTFGAFSIFICCFFFFFFITSFFPSMWHSNCYAIDLLNYNQMVCQCLLPP